MLRCLLTLFDRKAHIIKGLATTLESITNLLYFQDIGADV